MGGAVLSKAALMQAKLQDANFELADLEQANLHQASLEGAKLARANLRGAILEGCNLQRANLREADLEGANLDRANLREADLTGANLERADVSGAQLQKASLRHARLRQANLTGANLEEADLRKANLERANFRGADLRTYSQRQWYNVLFPFSGRPFILDDTRILGARFSPHCQDPWSILRRTYTGPKLAFVLFFTVLAFLPLLGQALFWSTVNRMERRAFPVGTAVLRRSVDFVRRYQALGEGRQGRWLSRSESFLTQIDRKREQARRGGAEATVSIAELRTLTELLNEARRQLRSLNIEKRKPSSLGELREASFWIDNTYDVIARFFPRSDIKLSERKVWQLLLGTDRGAWASLLALSLLVYNGFRGLLTYCVAPLREEEERTNDSPAWRDYGHLWRIHQVLSILVILAIVSGGLQLWETLNTPVLVVL